MGCGRKLQALAERFFGKYVVVFVFGKNVYYIERVNEDYSYLTLFLLTNISQCDI